MPSSSATICANVVSWPWPYALGEEGHADSHQLAARPLLRLLPTQLVVAGDVHGDLHGLRVVARVVRPAGRGLVGELLRLDEAAHPQLDGVDAHLHCERIDHALHEVDRLRDPERAA